jgi:hypothetical protein
LTVEAFISWCGSAHKLVKGGGKAATAATSALDVDASYAFYKNVINSDKGLSTLASDRMDSILTELLMYNDSSLLHEALKLLIIHKSQKVTRLCIPVPTP